MTRRMAGVAALAVAAMAVQSGGGQAGAVQAPGAQAQALPAAAPRAGADQPDALRANALPAGLRPADLRRGDALPAQLLPAGGQVIRHDGAEVTLHLPGFLSEEERSTLQMIAASPEALAAMLGAAGSGHAAIAVAPEEGLIRDGVPSASATAIGELPDAATARAEALRLCDAARATATGCVLVLEVAPTR